MPVPLLDLRPQLAPLRAEILAAIAEVLDSTAYILGPRVASLESAMQAYCATPAAIGVSSGTDALLSALMALEVGPGDLVLTSPYSFFAATGSILRLGARPVFVDIDPQSYNLDPDGLQDFFTRRPAETARVKACLPVHLYGQSADMARILPLCAEHGIPVVEDAAQAIGARCPLGPAARRAAEAAMSTTAPGGDFAVAADWHRVGSMGLVGCFSFFPSKNLGGIGDGGMVVCRDQELAAKIRTLRMHGGTSRYHHDLLGGNFRLDPIQAVVLEIKLRHLPGWHLARRRNAERYRQLFTSSGLVAEGAVSLPVAVYQREAVAAGIADFHVYNQFVVRVRQRDELRTSLHQAGIGCEIYYPVPLHQQGCVAKLGYNQEVFPEAERAARETLALPIYPELTEEMQQEVVRAIRAFYRHS